MTLDEKKDRAVQRVGDAVNAAIEQSPIVEESLSSLRRLGVEARVCVKLEIGLRELSEAELEPVEEIELELTEEDVKTLRRMKISIEG